MAFDRCHVLPQAARWSLALGLLIASGAGPASAQAGGCRVTAFTDPPRELLVCPDGLSIAAERGAAYRLVDTDRDGSPEAVELTAKGLLIEKSSRRRGGFQVLTPHAIASVRGTSWAVEVKPAATSVFVRTGRVGVTRVVSQSAGVVLAPGDGIDLGAGGGPLRPTRWGRDRVLHLLARFGR